MKSIHEVDQVNPGAVEEIRDDRFYFKKATATVSVDNKLFSFEYDSEQSRVKCTKYENAFDMEAIVITAMPELP